MTRPRTVVPAPKTSSPRAAPDPTQVSSTTGVPANPGCDQPSTTTASVIVGSPVAAVMVWTPAPGTANRIVSGPGWALVSRIACRSEPTPASAVVVTTPR